MSESEESIELQENVFSSSAKNGEEHQHNGGEKSRQKVKKPERRGLALVDRHITKDGDGNVLERNSVEDKLKGN